MQKSLSTENEEKHQLSAAEEYLLLKYRACAEMEKSMDTAEVLFLNGQFDEAKKIIEDRIKKKLKQGQSVFEDRNKLADIERQDGQLETANQIIKKNLAEMK